MIAEEVYLILSGIKKYVLYLYYYIVYTPGQDLVAYTLVGLTAQRLPIRVPDKHIQYSTLQGPRS